MLLKSERNKTIVPRPLVLSKEEVAVYGRATKEKQEKQLAPRKVYRVSKAQAAAKLISIKESLHTQT